MASKVILRRIPFGRFLRLAAGSWGIPRWIISGGIVLLLPKCLVCAAAYIAVASGFGLATAELCGGAGNATGNLAMSGNSIGVSIGIPVLLLTLGILWAVMRRRRSTNGEWRNSSCSLADQSAGWKAWATRAGDSQSGRVYLSGLRKLLCWEWESERSNPVCTESNFVKQPNAFFTAGTTFEVMPGGKTKYTIRTLHWTVESREKHEKMGFHQGGAKVTTVWSLS